MKCLFCPDLAGIICNLEFIKESSIQTKSKRSFLGYKKYTKKVKETTSGWAHLTCVNYIYPIWFEDDEERTKVVGVNSEKSLLS